MTKHLTKIAALMLASALASPVLAAGTHPTTGEALADDQTFTYRVLAISRARSPVN